MSANEKYRRFRRKMAEDTDSLYKRGTHSSIWDTIIMSLYMKRLNQQNKPFYRNHEIPYINQVNGEVGTTLFDGYAPEGYDDFEGPTVIEITSFLAYFLDETMNNPSWKYRKTGLKNAVFIYIKEDLLDSQDKENIREWLKNFFDEDINISIIDLEDINLQLNEYPEIRDLYKLPQEKLFEIDIEESISNEKDNWIETRNEYIKELRVQHKKGNLSLFLGAGVSKEAKVATWDELINELLVSLVSKKLSTLKDIKISDEEKMIFVEVLKKENGNSPLQLARYIRNGLDNFFLSTVSEILYKNSLEESKLLKEICDLCFPIEGERGVQGIITYNFDDLLERNLKRANIKHTSIYKEAQIPNRNELGIHHVHGFLPREIEQYEEISKSSIIFSEEGYHELALDYYNWSNLVQLNYFREYTCLFIGISLTDPNVRRLLDIAMSKQPDKSICPHYIFLRRGNFLTESNQLNVNESNLKKLERIDRNQKEKSLKELGLKIIWIDDFDEIPNLLQEIKGR